MNPLKRAERQTNIKKILPLVLVIIIIVAIIIICIFCDNKTSFIICLSIFLLSTIGRIIVNKKLRTNEVRVKIDDKIETLKKVYDLFEIKNHNTIIAINTKDFDIISAAKKLFPGSNETKNTKNLYSLMLPNAPLEELCKFINKYNPEYLILHKFSTIEDNNKKTRTHSVSICLEKELIIKYSKKSYSLQQIKELLKELKSK